MSARRTISLRVWRPRVHDRSPSRRVAATAAPRACRRRWSARRRRRSFPAMATPVRSRSSMQPARRARHEQRLVALSARSARCSAGGTRPRPSRKSIAPSTRSSSMWSGSGSWTKMPWHVGVGVVRLDDGEHLVLGRGPRGGPSREGPDPSLLARLLLASARTSRCLCGRPTRTTARPGTFPPVLLLHGGDRAPNFLAHVRGDRFAVDDLRVRADRRSDRARDARSGRGRLEGAREGGASEGGGVHGVHSSRRRGAVVSDEKVFFKASTEKSGRRALRGK